MAYMNQPIDLNRIYTDLDARLRKLETAVRFTAPNVDFGTNTPPYPRVGDQYYDTSGDVMTYWNGTDWIVIGDNNLGTPVETWTPTWAGTGLTFTGTPASGRYQRVGKMIFYTIRVNCTTVTAFGTGQYSVTLPIGLNPGYDFQHVGGLHKGSNHYTLLANLEAGTNVVTLYHPTSNGAQDVFNYNKPTVLTTASYFYISGTYFIA